MHHSGTIGAMHAPLGYFWRDACTTNDDKAMHDLTTIQISATPAQRPVSFWVNLSFLVMRGANVLSEGGDCSVRTCEGTRVDRLLSLGSVWHMPCDVCRLAGGR
jgi:hypothetical protein